MHMAGFELIGVEPHPTKIIVGGDCSPPTVDSLF
jgi:hypothetical protein